ncbi:YdcF family protein [Paenibacillus sp. S-38]|uniref:YdcF family protein n=1 Tax=Paenibacillus sp. S-38 TaxID=3416710 RepID=UPI003CF95264
MIYVIKLVYSFLFPPGLYILILLLLGAWLYFRVRRSAGIVLAAAALLFYFMSIPLTGEGLLKSIEDRYDPPKAVEGDVYVMLTGGGVSGTPDISATGHLSGSTLHRVVAVSELYAKKPLPILISGGQVYEDTVNEGRLSKQKLIALGVPEKAILLDDASRTTQENARNSKALLDQQGFRKPILVTSAFHMARSIKHFSKQGVEVLPYPVDYKISRYDGGMTSRLWIPTAGAQDSFSLALKEYVGMLQ